jgi:hypothetical protein
MLETNGQTTIRTRNIIYPPQVSPSLF